MVGAASASYDRQSKLKLAVTIGTLEMEEVCGGANEEFLLKSDAEGPTKKGKISAEATGRYTVRESNPGLSRGRGVFYH